MKIAVDTNVLVRYLIWDDVKQATEAAETIEQAEGIVVSTIVLCELVWVLKRAYRIVAADIVDAIRRIIDIRGVDLDRPAVEAGLAMLTRGGDFADGVIQFDAICARCQRVVTFDQDFARLLGSDAVTLLGTR